MAGLSNLIANSTQQATTLPSWMTTAQQNVVNSAQNAAGNVPTLQNTVAQGAINQLNSPANPFATSQGTLGSIASGAANPWIVNQQTGQVTPNVNTALGGLFQAQNQQLNTLIPQITAPADAAAIASGQFGSLRGNTAADTALTGANANLAAAQMQAALSNQQTGVQAGAAQGAVGQEYGTTANTLAGLQQTAPLSTAANVGKIIGNLGNVGTTVSSSTNVSPLNQIGALASSLGGGTNAVNALLNTLSPGATLGSLVGSIFGTTRPGGVPSDASPDPSGSGNWIGTNGQVYSQDGTPIDTSGSVSSAGDQAVNATVDQYGNVTSQFDPNAYGAG